MPDDAVAPSPSPQPLPPRPPAPSGASAFADRLRRWREDPRVAALLLLTCAVAAGGFWFRSGISGASPSTAGASTAPAPATTAPAAPPTTVAAPAAVVVVHVAGAVAKPGVVTLAAKRRVVDAIDAAGGPLPDADLDRLNLAAPLTDGSRIAVPKRGEPAPALEPAATPGPAGATTTEGAPATGPINLNTATQAELETLPGIGPTLAQAIVAERERSGGFRSVEDLRRVRGIGDARFAQVQPLVTV
jgi:competence protein ComEA